MSTTSEFEDLETRLSSSDEDIDLPCTSRGRGGKRGRGRPSRGKGKAAASGRGRGKKRAAAHVQMPESTEDNVKRLQREMEEEVNRMDIHQLRTVLLNTIQKDPGLMIEILQPAEQQPGQGYHPPSDVATPDWCVCGHCREMPTALEKKCCGKVHCVSCLPKFNILILDEGVLALARMYRRDVLVYVDDVDIRKANRHQAYRQFILWTHGKLGSGDRRVIPSCCVWKIRDKFPDPFNQYKGFVPSRLS